MPAYKIGHYHDTPDGKKFVPVFKRAFDSDAQAELEVRNLGRYGDLPGLYIRRGDREWFCEF